MTTTTTSKKTTASLPSRSNIQSAFGALRRDLESRSGQEVSPRPAAATAAEKEIFAEVARAVQVWKESPAGRAVLQPEFFDLETLRREIDAFLLGDGFARSRLLIAEQRELGKSEITFPIQAVSLGIAAQIDLIGGLYGSIGYAADLDDISNTSVIYILGALQEGVIEGGDVAVQVGLWKNSTNDFDGYYNGQTVEVGIGGEVAVFALESGLTPVAFLVDVGAGEEGGIAEDQVLVYTFDISRSPVAQQDASHLLILTQLECENSSESGHDEVYFYFQPDGGTSYRYPTWDYYAMSQDSTDPDHVWACGRSVKLNESVKITLWDVDDVSDDKLGATTFSLGDFSGPGDTVSKTFGDSSILDDIQYKLTAKLVY